MKQMQSRRKKKNGGLCRRLLVLALLVGLLANTVGCVGGQRQHGSGYAKWQ